MEAYKLRCGGVFYYRFEGWAMKRAVGRVGATLAAWAMLAAGTAMARDPEPPLRIPLEPMGYQAMVQEFLLAGSSMLTVDFADKDHLLITFAVRRLMKREADADPDDDDRTVGAFLVELPSGKVLARTEWRLHDHMQYLWNLGHGRFLLRVRDRLTLFAPLQAGTLGDPFQQTRLVRMDRRIVAILVSSEHDLLTIESMKRQAGGEGGGPPQDPAPVQLDFYRLSDNGDLGAGKTAIGLAVSPAGSIRTRMAVDLPMTAAGILDVIEGGKDRWLFNFDELTGKADELAEWDTTCFPRATFAGHAEFVAFGCRGSADKVAFAGFNLKGEQMWQQSFLDSFVSPMFAFAPAAGRFALGRTIVSATFDADFPLPASAVTAQEVRVYQSYNGQQVFKIECSPVERAGQNFALSEDGLRLAVVRETMVRHPATQDYEAYTAKETAVEVYALPALSDKDQAAVKAAEALAPADSGVRIDLALERLSNPAAAGTAAANEVGGTGAGGDASAGATAGGPQAGSGSRTEGGTGGRSASGTERPTVVEGDPDPDVPRKPPTLYGPGEKPPEKTTPQ